MLDVGWKENTKHPVLLRHGLVLLSDGLHLSYEPQGVVIMRPLTTRNLFESAHLPTAFFLMSP